MTKSKPINLSAATQVFTWKNDPGSGSHPTGGTALLRPVPKLALSPLPMTMSPTGSTGIPAAGVYTQGTPEFRVWAASEAARRGADFWGSRKTKITKWNPNVGAKLPIRLDEGVDLNAFYDRSGLSFFHDIVAGRTVFSGEGSDVICHELGHAVLDSIRPQLWNAPFVETAAFHEAFGDMSAILSALQISEMRQAVLFETEGILSRSSSLSRLAEQLGWAIRQRHPGSAEPDCLRNAVNSLFYQDPSTIPTSAPASQLSSEAHSFSRVFTGGFFQTLANMFAGTATKDEAALEQVSQDLGDILVQAILSAPVVPNYYSQVAAHMITATTNIKYKNAIKDGFVSHGVLSVTSATGITGVATSAGLVGIAGVPDSANAIALAPDNTPDLPEIILTVPEFGLNSPTLVVCAAPEPAADNRRFSVAGASTNATPVTPPSHEEAAHLFVAELFRRGRIEIGEHADAEVAVFQPNRTKTHRLEAAGDAVRLVRMRVYCGCGEDCFHNQRKEG